MQLYNGHLDAVDTILPLGKLSDDTKRGLIFNLPGMQISAHFYTYAYT